MLRLSAKTIVIVALACFMGLVALQIVWMQSAYENEAALYSKAKKQFETELQSALGQNEQLKAGLKQFLDHYNGEQSLDTAQMDWFYFNFVQAVQFSSMQSQFGIDVHGVNIGRQGSTNTIIAEKHDSTEIARAGKLCIPCILGFKNEWPKQYDYQVLLFYKDQWTTFFEKLGFLIVVSLLLLIVLGFLFREIMRKYNQEKKLSEAKNDFINNLTHEMQTPVFAIQMANRLIKEKTDEQFDIAPFTSIIDKEAGQLKLHAGKILDLASLEQGQVAMSKAITELNAFISQKRATIELMLKAKNGELKVKPHSELLYCEIDPVHFNNVLLSLVDNAIKYSNNPPRILIETGTAKSNKVCLKLTDKGIGISSEYLPFIFDKFYRVPHVKRNGITGFGLGLSYVKNIVELHGGEIKVSSEEGEGTTITILLPKATVNA
jgi:signal transduction histidine kinase